MNRQLLLGVRGARDRVGRSDIARLVNAVRREAHGLDVVDGYLDSQEPDLASLVGATSGPRALVPLLLTRDRVAEAAIARAAAADPSVFVTPALGPDWLLAEIGVERLVAAGARPDDTLVLATEALADERAVADVGQAARFLSAVWGGRVHVGSLGGPDTPLSEAIDIARAYGRRVVVSSYLLTRGEGYEQVRGCGADLVTEPLLGVGAPDARLVALVLDRARSRGRSVESAAEPRLAHG